MTAAAIARTNQRLIDAFARQDLEAATRCYTADAKLMAPFAPAYVGHTAIRDFLAAGFARGIAGLALETVALEVLGDTAWEEGAYRTLDGAGGVLDQGKYIVVWKQIGADWLMARDIMSSDRPAAPPG